ncbi:MAG TPA: hypothetical protein VFB80_07995, partial [Pirellulaceae bacterium]|nr:hypothetical protein [Pirellulaceae bacterium]
SLSDGKVYEIFRQTKAQGKALGHAKKEDGPPGQAKKEDGARGHGAKAENDAEGESPGLSRGRVSEQLLDRLAHSTSPTPRGNGVGAGRAASTGGETQARAAAFAALADSDSDASGGGREFLPRLVSQRLLKRLARGG